MKSKILFAGVLFALFSTFTSYAATPQDGGNSPENVQSDTTKKRQDPRLDELRIKIEALGEAIESLEEVVESKDLPEEAREEIRKQITELKKEREKLIEKRDKIKKEDPNSKSGDGDIEINDEYIYWDWNKDEKKKKKKEKLPNYKTRLLGLDFGFNTLQYTGPRPAPAQVDSLELRPGIGSYTLKLHLLQSGVNLIKHHFYLTYSLTFDWQRYSFAKNINIQPRSNTLRISSEPFEFDKNTLMAVYFGVPLMFHYETKPNKRNSFHLAAGGYGNFLIDSYTKQKSYEEGSLKMKDRFNLDPYQYGVAAQIGYRRINLYGQYSLSSVFKKSEGPSLSNLNFGITIIGFHWY